MTDLRRLYQLVASLDSDYEKKAVRLLTDADRNSVLEQKLHDLLARGTSIEDAGKLAKQIGRELTHKEIEAIHEYYVSSGWLMGADQTAALLGREVTQSELPRMFRPRLENYNRADVAMEIARRVSDQKHRVEFLEKIIAFCVKRGWTLGEVQEAARLIGRELTYRELSAFCGMAVLSGRLSEAQDIARLMGRELTKTELLDTFNAANRMRWFKEARDAALLLPEPARTECLAETLRESVEKGDLAWAKDIAGILGRNFTQDELSKLLERAFWSPYNENVARVFEMIPETERIDVLARIIESSQKQGKTTTAKRAADLALKTGV